MTQVDAVTQQCGPASGPRPLLERAAALAQYADAECRPHEVLDTVRGWGERLRARVAADTSSLNRLRLLNFFFYDELGFQRRHPTAAGCDVGYLHRVVEHRAGHPIALSLLYIEIGRAIGLKLFGVAFPGRFLVKLAIGDRLLFVDVGAHGSSLSADALRSRLAQALGGPPRLPLQLYLRAASDDEILASLLRAWRAVHTADGDLVDALAVQNRLLEVLPDAAEERLERAALFEQLDCPTAAAEDLDAYLRMQPDADDRAVLRRHLATLRQAARRLN